MKLEKNCPIPRTHTRLRQAHLAWHETFEAYPDADEFCRRLNAVIPALRSVTWMLQKEKHGDPDFDSWYEAQQREMNADPKLRWLVEARNHIEKKGDLEPHSTAHVTLVAGALESPTLKLEVPPLVGPEGVATLVRATLGDPLPERVKRDMTLRVERRWVLTELPDSEVMEALAHCYGRLALIVAEAHARRGVEMQTFGGETHEGEHKRKPHPAGKLPCMAVHAAARTVHWSLGDDMLLSVEETNVPRGDTDSSRERYKHLIMPSIDETAGFLDRAEAFHSSGKQMLANDGYHVPIALFISDRKLEIASFVQEDQQSKDMMMEEVARLVDRYGATELIFSTEAWLARQLPPMEPHAILPARERRDRSEVFISYALSRDGDGKVFITPFHRRDGKPDGEIVLDETNQDDLREPHAFRRVIEVWDTWPSAARA
jgi:hypothetical protein